MIDGVEIIELRKHEDERGWFVELRRESAMPQPTLQTNLVWSRKGTIRALHFHKKQSDLFACLEGKARIVVLDLETGEADSVDIGDDNFVAVWVPGHLAHGYEALTDVLMCYHVTQEYDPSDEFEVRWDDPRVEHLWQEKNPILSERDRNAS